MEVISRKCHMLELEPENFVKYYTNFCQNSLQDDSVWIII